MDSWQKQSKAPLFPDILWSRPQIRTQAGKLMVSGGHSHSFSSPAQSFSAADSAGAGSIRVLLPDALKKLVGPLLPEAEFAPCTPSGSYARSALSEFLDLGGWADAVILAGDFGRNSETAVLLESFVAKYSGLLTLSGDSLDYFYTEGQGLLRRNQTLIAATLTQLQKLLIGSSTKIAVKNSMDLMQLVISLQKISADARACIMTSHNGSVLLAHEGLVSTTAMDTNAELTSVSSAATVLWMQNPGKPFEALSSGVWLALQAQGEAPDKVF